ncbi:PAS domain-containing sensor histidine kinase [Rufibacter radiotolerans]|uniref:PAS domain-containing sensor histidine kinase n=1 Tax=Rufibacter radiotolerans TaxID=1379910 RepID=UPI0006647F99|nr:PAS domain-containing sensor histidine kinase [Rufibacter radiotolerans]
MKNTKAAFYASLVEQAAEAFGQAYFVYQDGQNALQYVNGAFAKMFGVDTEKVLYDATGLVDRVHADDRDFLTEQYHQLQNSLRQSGIEFRIQVPGQPLKWICLNCAIIEMEATRYITGYAEDITKRKEYQSNILKFNSKKNSTLEILSHDLAAPFNNIEGMIKLLEAELKSANPMTLELVGYIKENATKGSDLIRDFVDNEFLESSQVVLHKERVDITQKLGIMMDNYQHVGDTLLEKNFTANLPAEPVFVYLDVMKFMQVLNNLVSNAMKFTREKGTITVSLEPKSDTVLITVADNGIGIPNHLKPYLFDKFTKARREGLRGEKSVGLGMSIIKNIVNLHEGKIWFESEEGKGSSFYVEIPKN